MKSALFRAFFIYAVLCSNLALISGLSKLRSRGGARIMSFPDGMPFVLCAISITADMATFREILTLPV